MFHESAGQGFDKVLDDVKNVFDRSVDVSDPFRGRSTVVFQKPPATCRRYSSSWGDRVWCAGRKASCFVRKVRLSWRPTWSGHSRRKWRTVSGTPHLSHIFRHRGGPEFQLLVE